MISGYASTLVQVGQVMVSTSWSFGGIRDKAAFYLPFGPCIRGTATFYRAENATNLCVASFHDDSRRMI